MNTLYYKLNKQINGQKLLGDIIELISEYQKNQTDQHEIILTISIKPVEYDDHTMIPKLEYYDTGKD